MRSAVSFLFAVSLVSCGSRSETKTNSPDQSKNSFFSKAETPTVAPEVVKGAYAEFPATTSALFRMQDPWKWASTAHQIAKKVAPDEVAAFESQATAEAGFNVFDVKAINEFSGFDVTKPISVYTDSALHVKTFRKDLFTETASTAEAFALVIQGTLSNKEKLTANLQLVAANGGRTTTNEANGASFVYMYDSGSDGERLYVAVALKENTAKAIVCPEGIDAQSEAEFKKQIESYATTAPAKPLSENDFFKQMTAHADPTGDMFFFVDTMSLAISVEGMLGPLSQGPEAAQVKDVITKVVASMPGMATSMSFSEKGVRGTGAVKLIAPKVESMRSMLPSKDAPPYGSIFPENTSYFIRTSTNLLGIKDYAMYLVPKEFVPQAESYLAMANAAIGLYAPLNVEADILGAFSGHMGYSIDYSSMLSGGVPKFHMIAQLSSEAAGDKLLSAIAALPKQLNAPVPVNTEEVSGDKLYSIAAGPVEVAWGRSSDLLVIGMGTASVKEMFARIKSPPATTFVDKSSSELAKSMVNSKSGSGTYIDMGVIFSSLLTSPELSDPKAKAVLAKIAPMLGPITSQTLYNPETQLDVSIIEMSFK
jgi:hypothetical protein